jgi:hypothetical protein
VIVAGDGGERDPPRMSNDQISPGGEDQDEDLPWDARIRRLVDFAVGETLIEENLRRTPTRADSTTLDDMFSP